MGLKALLKSLEDVDESLRPLYKEEADGSFILDVDESDFKSKLGEFRNNNTNLKKELTDLKKQLKGFTGTAEELQAIKDKFEGLDADAARDAIKLIQEQQDKNMIDSGKIDELVEQRSSIKIKEVSDAHSVEMSDLQSKLNNSVESNTVLNSRLTKVSVDNAVQSSISDVATVKKGAMRDVLGRAREIFSLNDDGKPVPKNAEGNIILGEDGEKPMSIKEWAHSLVQDAPYLFEGSSGGGAPGGGVNDGGQNTSSVNSSDQEGINNSIQEIAAGKVTIQQ